MKKITLIILILVLVFKHISAQIPEPTENQALLNVIITDFNEIPRTSETIIFVSESKKIEYKAITNEKGEAFLLVPKGDIYNISYRDFISHVNYSRVEIPKEEGKIILDIIIKFEPEKVFTLNNVFYEVGKADLTKESFAALNELVDLLLLKKDIEIEISGHTDSDGSYDMNMKLSQARAESVVKYLVSKGISASRLVAKGYGPTKPIAPNDTPAGRQQNRRTEVKILNE